MRWASLALLLAGCAAASPLDGLRAPRTEKAAREAFVRDQRAALEEGFRGTVDEERWPGLFWTAGLIGARTPLVRDALARALAACPAAGVGFRRAALQSVHALFPGEFAAEVRELVTAEDDPLAFAIGCYDLLRAGAEPAGLRELLESRFPYWADEARLRALHHRLRVDPVDELRVRPPLADLLAAPLVPGYPVVFSLHRHDRRQPGLALVRGVDGEFVRRLDGELFAVPHLALSSTDLPGTVTFGNTPQGIHTIRGTGVATNVFIGPTPFLHAMLPCEAGVADFLHGMAGGAWREDLYARLLPRAWRGYSPIYEAWLAGRAGRSEILAHGTTIDPSFHAGEPFWPLTPSAGCLTAREIWADDGRLVASDQLELLGAFLRSGEQNGFLVVVEIDARAAPVALDDVRDAVEAAELAGSSRRF